MIKYVPVSVIIPCYCSSQTVERAYESVREQTVLPKEIIFIDDASPDNGKTCIVLNNIKNNETNISIKVLQKLENKGPASARNSGWNAAEGEYVAFLDSDDVWKPMKLEMQYSVMKDHPEVLFSSHRFEKVRLDDCLDFDEPFKLFTISKRKELFKHTVYTSSVMVKTNCLYKFDEAHRYSEDFLLWIELLQYKGLYIDAVLTNIFKKTYGESGLSANMVAMEHGELSALYKLWNKKIINNVECALAIVFSLLKFFLRIVHLK